MTVAEHLAQRRKPRMIWSPAEGQVYVFGFFILAFVFCLSGCGGTFWGHTVEFFRPEGDPNDDVISRSYKETRLKESSAADVLAVIYMPQYELLSRSKSVIASSGQKKAGYKRWLKMVAFDENELTASRKYLLIVDEKPKFLFVEPWANLRFDCEMVLGAEVLDEPYSNENAMRIAILRRVLANVRRDMDQIGQDNEMADICGMLVNQGLETVLVKLDSSPVLAGWLSEPEGLSFEHISFDKGKIRMLVDGDIVTVGMKLGSILKKRLEWSGRALKYKRADE